MPKKTRSKATRLTKKKNLSPLLQACQDLFGTTDLYEVICVRKEATHQEVKKGYYKKSLEVHPDRVSGEEKEAATRKFQTLGKVYALLSCKDKRALYDETGDAGEEDESIEQDRSWCEYWQQVFPKVTLQALAEFTQKYQGSAEELKDLKAAYIDGEGDMDIIMDSIMCSTSADEERFKQILKDLIAKGEVPDFNKFTKESKQKKAARQKKAKGEAAEAEEEAKRLRLDDSEDSLRALIQKRNSSRAEQADGFFASLEAKYAQPQKRGKRKK